MRMTRSTVKRTLSGPLNIGVWHVELTALVVAILTACVTPDSAPRPHPDGPACSPSHGICFADARPPDAAAAIDAPPPPDAATAACSAVCGPTETVYCSPAAAGVCWCVPSHTPCVPSCVAGGVVPCACGDGETCETALEAEACATMGSCR